MQLREKVSGPWSQPEICVWCGSSCRGDEKEGWERRPLSFLFISMFLIEARYAFLVGRVRFSRWVREQGGGPKQAGEGGSVAGGRREHSLMEHSVTRSE